MKAHHDEGKSLGEVAKLLGWSPSTVSRQGKKHGLDWLRVDALAPALISRRMTNADKRVSLETRLLDESHRMLDQMHQPMMAYNIGGKDNTYTEHELPTPDIPGQRNIMAAVGVAIDKALKIAEINAQAKDQSDVDRWLEMMTADGEPGKGTVIDHEPHTESHLSSEHRRDDAEPMAGTSH